MKAAEKTPAHWQKTQYANLIRYKPSGMYFARLRVAGKLVRKSLKTDVITTAKLRLGDLEKEERKAVDTEQSLDNGKLTFADALTVYKQRLDGNANLKKRTKDYYNERIKALLKSWSVLEATPVRKITRTDCLIRAPQ